MKFRLIEEEKSQYPVSPLARVLAVLSTGYHAGKKRPAPKRRTDDERSHGIYGAPCIHRPTGSGSVSCGGG